jgi:uncharacterized phage protein (TIGR02216 family)
MALGLGHLRLPPGAFWAMTLPELAAALRGTGGVHPAPMVRGELDALMARFPDAKHPSMSSPASPAPAGRGKGTQ